MPNDSDDDDNVDDDDDGNDGDNNKKEKEEQSKTKITRKAKQSGSSGFYPQGITRGAGIESKIMKLMPEEVTMIKIKSG